MVVVVGVSGNSGTSSSSKLFFPSALPLAAAGSADNDLFVIWIYELENCFFGCMILF